MKGYKATKLDMTCRGFQFDIGQEYSVNNDLVICKTGFHFCQDFEAISDYYPFENNNRYFEIEAIGEVITRGNKSCTSKIRIIRELNDEELKIFGIFKTIENELTKICYNGSQYWYLNGIELTEQEFNNRNRPCVGKVVVVDGIEYTLA